MSLSPRSHADGGAAPEGCGSCWGSGWGEQDPPHVCRVPPWAFPSSPESQHGCTESLLLQVMGIMVSLVPTASLRCMGGGGRDTQQELGGGADFFVPGWKKSGGNDFTFTPGGSRFTGGGMQVLLASPAQHSPAGGEQSPPPPHYGVQTPIITPLGGGSSLAE